MGLKEFGINFDLDAKHELFALCLRFHLLGRELGPWGDKGHLGRDGYVGQGVEHNSCLCARIHPASLLCGQEDGHVHIGKVEDCQDFAPRGKNLTGLGQAIQESTAKGGLKEAVIDLGLDFVSPGLLDYYGDCATDSRGCQPPPKAL